MLQIFLWKLAFNYFEYIPRSGIARSHGSSIFNLGGNLHTVFHSGHTNLHSHQQRSRVAFLRIFTNICYLCPFWWAPLAGARWHLAVVLIYISPTISAVEHPSMCLLAICISSWGKRVFRFSAHFLIKLSFFYVACTSVHICWIIIPLLSYHLWHFLPFRRFNKWCRENWTSTCKRVKLEHSFILYTKYTQNGLKT